MHVAVHDRGRAGLADASVRFEVQVETPQSVLGPGRHRPGRPDGARGDGRLTGLHYGTYDYSAFCGIAAAQQSLEHPAADHAKLVMQVAAAGTGVRLRRLHQRAPRRRRRRRAPGLGEPPAAGPPIAGARVLPGLGPAPGAAAHAVRRDVRLLPRRLARALARLRTTRSSGEGGRSLDEPATARALADFLLRGLDCGAVDPTEVSEESGLGTATTCDWPAASPRHPRGCQVERGPGPLELAAAEAGSSPIAVNCCRRWRWPCGTRSGPVRSHPSSCSGRTSSRSSVVRAAYPARSGGRWPGSTWPTRHRRGTSPPRRRTLRRPAS